MDDHIERLEIDRRILLVRGLRVILSDDLALMYGVPVHRLNQSVRRHRERFPDSFMLQLTQLEYEDLASRFPELTGGHGGRRTLPYVFTEHGPVMLASVLKSRVAVAASIQIVLAFNRMRRMIAAHADLAAKISELESKYDSHDAQIQELFAAIRRLLDPPPDPPREIGFRSD